MSTVLAPLELVSLARNTVLSAKGGSNSFASGEYSPRYARTRFLTSFEYTSLGFAQLGWASPCLRFPSARGGSKIMPVPPEADPSGFTKFDMRPQVKNVVL